MHMHTHRYTYLCWRSRNAIEIEAYSVEAWPLLKLKDSGDIIWPLNLSAWRLALTHQHWRGRVQQHPLQIEALALDTWTLKRSRSARSVPNRSLYCRDRFAITYVPWPSVGRLAWELRRTRNYPRRIRRHAYSLRFSKLTCEKYCKTQHNYPPMSRICCYLQAFVFG